MSNTAGGLDAENKEKLPSQFPATGLLCDGLWCLQRNDSCIPGN
jgi:hypothetical protein